jgi:hypothetical protein
MKHGIFISYSDYDKDKVDLIVNELEGSTKFFPIVIASNREALKPLAQKVADGIIQAKVILPILTKNSIPTQWINQEIGFATALSKRIMPIVENDLIDNLKGFIHKQIDLPYNYQPKDNKETEHNDFIKQVRNLLADLEKEFQKLVTAEELPEKSDFEKSLEQADKLNEELEFKRQRAEYLNSGYGAEAATAEVLNMYVDIEEKMKKLKEKNFHFAFEKEFYQPTFILKSEGFSFSIAWQPQYSNTTEGASLYVQQWKGHVTKERSTFYFPDEEPKILSDIKYTFDRNRNNEICWLSQKDKKLYNSVQIVDACLNWLVGQVAKKRLELR